MAQLLVTTANQRYFYDPIASIKNYSETGFEDKLFKYSKELFENYHVIKYKFPIKWKSDVTKSYKPDLLLISKKFNKWVIVEIELCKPDMSHTFKQIDCFLNPFFDPSEVIKNIISQKSQLNAQLQELTYLINNHPPQLLVILDDYSNKVFDKLYGRYKDLQICVLEVYRRAGYQYDAYRLGGNYPYDITNSTKLSYFDEEYYEILKPDLVKDIASGDLVLNCNMIPLKGELFKPKGRSKKYLLKIPNHNFDKTDLLQLAIDVNDELIIQIL